MRQTAHGIVGGALGEGDGRVDVARRARLAQVERDVAQLGAALAMLRNPVARLARLAVARTVGRLGPVQRRIALWVTGLERSPLRADLPSVASAVDLGSAMGRTSSSRRHRPRTADGPLRPVLRGLSGRPLPAPRPGADRRTGVLRRRPRHVGGQAATPDIEAIFTDPATFSAAIAQDPVFPLADEARTTLREGGFRAGATMSNCDPPKHTRIRRRRACRVLRFHVVRGSCISPPTRSISPQ